MSASFSHWLRSLAIAAPAALAAAVLALPASAQNAPAANPPAAAKDTKDAAKDTAKDAKDTAKDTAKDARDTAKDAKDSAKDTARDTRDTAKDTAKDAARDARDTTKDARDSARDTAKDARDTTRDARDDARDTKRGATDPARDARDDTRDRPRDTVRDPRDPRDPARDQSRDARDPANIREPRDSRDTGDTRDSRDSRDNNDVKASFSARGTRAADFGLWFERDSSKGLVIADVATRGAIAKLGFREGDRIVSVNGQRISREDDFVTYLFADDVRNDRVKVIVIRDGREEVIHVEPTVFVEELSYVDNDPLEHFGVIVDDRYTDRIVVWRVVPRSPAYYAGIRAGDVIVSLGDNRLANVAAFVQRLTNIDPGEVQVQVNRDDRNRTIHVDVPRFVARSQRRTSFRPNFDGASERREDRLERREDRVEDRQERRESIDAVPSPRPNVPAPRVNPPAVNPPAVTPAPAPAPRPAPAPGRDPAPRPGSGLFPRNR